MKKQGFQFKQFAVQHDDVAMKVGTDSIMLGSWVDPLDAKRILDVGTGSGLLALMLAQKNMLTRGEIVAIDIDAAAVEQAKRNVAASPWPTGIQVIHQSLQQCEQQPFDLIISNPPYYPSGQIFDSQRQQARHQADLDFAALTTNVARLLCPTGLFACVIPAQFESDLVRCAKSSALNLSRKLAVKTTQNKLVTRVLLEFSFEQLENVKSQQLTIHEPDGSYSQDYKNLCRDFYLKF